MDALQNVNIIRITIITIDRDSFLYIEFKKKNKTNKNK